MPDTKKLMTGEEADRFGVEAAREYCLEVAVGAGDFDSDRGLLSEEEVREWTERREERRRREGYKPV